MQCASSKITPELKTDLLSQELDLIRCMYPETVIEDKSASRIEGCIEINMLTTSGSLLVKYEEQLTEIEQLFSNNFQFVVRKETYPRYSECLEWTLESSWITAEDMARIKTHISSEFAETTYEGDIPLISMVLDSLSQRALSVLTDDAHMYICHDKAQWESFIKIRDEQEMRNAAYINFRCCICIEEKKGSKMVKLPCNDHFLCRECVKEYYHAMIDEGRIENVRCPECTYKPINLHDFDDFDQLKLSIFTPALSYTFFKGLLAESDINRYERLHKEEAFTKLFQHNPHLCIVCPRCDSWCLKDMFEENMIHCEVCDMVFCADCLHAWHGKQNICGKPKAINTEYLEEYTDECVSPKRKRELEIMFGKRSVILQADAYLATKMLEQALEEQNSCMKKCPKCGTIIEKTEGCNSMRCAICTEPFCFRCGLSLPPSNPYLHFNDIRSPCAGKLFEGMAGVEDV
ncbi:unnamed protein product [Kluyveromyces dobzhanskii CBS 2104]|uniref:RBR-type E3 ubiquitin transferase n=1 Tax=Kluyveromyces dobzhanskii CBS 2104 TaxID=1427455 RepID=A0A0A8L247_9SACH|nr:unnamed protein product [Kluyveromyces dobzhanskii CBS 2104]